MKSRLRFLPLAAVFLIAACGSTEPLTPQVTESMTAAKSAVRQAEQVGAREHAPVALRNAQQKITEAEQAMGKSEFEKARRLAQQAQVDAELAEITALASKQQMAVDELKKSIDTLREEVRRNRDN